MRRAAAVCQPQLDFDAGNPVSIPAATPDTSELYTLDVVSQQVLRTVRRRDPSESAVTTVISTDGELSSESDLREVADSFWLRTRMWPQQPKTTAAIRAVDVFSGIGAMSLGVAEACRALDLRFESAAAFDIDDLALKIYCRNFGIAAASGDLNALVSKQTYRTATRREKDLLRGLGRVDFLIAGPPCQGHSDLNNRSRRNDPRNDLYFRVARLAKLLEPRFIVVENVVAVLHDKNNVVDRTKNALKRLGYAVRDGIVDLRRIGVPQSRRRHVLLADRDRQSKQCLLDPREIVERYRVKERSVKWAIQDLEGMAPTSEFDRSANATPTTQRRIDWLFEKDAFDLPDAMRPPCHRYKAHTYRAVYGRMHADRVAPTITGGYDTMGRGRFVHYGFRRTITPHEAARLQFIPDFFDMSLALSNRTRLADLIGNAVPPKLSYVIALELLR